VIFISRFDFSLWCEFNKILYLPVLYFTTRISLEAAARFAGSFENGVITHFYNKLQIILYIYQLLHFAWSLDSASLLFLP